MRGVQFFGSSVCHQLPERSFQVQEIILPVCGRCTGIYMGFGLVFLYLWYKKRLYHNKPFSTQQTILCAMAFLPISIDGFFSYLGIWESNGFLRVVTGALAGMNLPIFLILGGNFQVGEENEDEILNGKEQGFILGITLCIGLLLWKGIGSYIFSSILISIGIFSFWMFFIYLMIKNLCNKKERPFWRYAAIGSVFMISVVGVCMR